MTDQRQLYLYKALQLFKLYGRRLSPSHFEYLILSANLIDSGRAVESLVFYQEAFQGAKASEDHIAAAAARRVYGRAKIASGEYAQGRTEMLAAVEEFKTLAFTPGFETDRMLGEAAETYRRLVWVEIEVKHMSDVPQDFGDMETLMKETVDPGRLRTLTSGVNQLREAIRERRVDVQLARLSPGSE